MLRTQNFKTNSKGRDFVVGDLHGELDKFNEQLEWLGFDESVDRMFSVGDLVDRGQDSIGCLELIRKDWFHAVKGNHEDMMILAVRTKEIRSVHHWHINGGIWSENVDEERLLKIVKEADKLPISITVEVGDNKIGICHAQPPASYDWNDVTNPSSENMMLWGRTRIRHNERCDIENITWTFHGHTVTDHVKVLGNSTFLDTGACFGNRPLTILEISDKGKLHSDWVKVN